MDGFSWRPLIGSAVSLPIAFLAIRLLSANLERARSTREEPPEDESRVVFAEMRVHRIWGLRALVIFVFVSAAIGLAASMVDLISRLL